MKIKRNMLWIHFVLIVFALLFATSFIVIFCAILLFRFGHLQITENNPLYPLTILLLMSVFIGTAISIFVARIILRPITKFSKGMEEVAKGNLNIRVNETEGVNEIKNLTHNFNKMVKELSSIETFRSDFVANVSHEYKTPIAAIEGYAMLLQHKELSEAERDEYTQMIIDSSRQLSTLSDNILRLSKLENQEVVFEKVPFRIDEQIRQAVLMLESEWNKKELNLQIDLEKKTYCGNEQLLWQVWMNLIGNAIKFTPQNGSISILLTSDKANIFVKISDTGCGMEEYVQKHVFDKFYQGDTTRKSDGNGLGLTLVKRIIDLCNGSIAIESEVGKGAAFTLTLPY